MKAIRPLFILLIFACTFVHSGFSQKSIKQTKQETKFFYTQINLNGGMLFSDSPKWKFSEVSPYSNLNFTYRAKSQRLLQRGYVQFAQLSDYKANFAIVYKNLSTENGNSAPRLSLQMRDLWLKIKTKWDRTSLKVGHFALPYGHAPKMDLDNSFIPALAGMDFGFNRDLGLLFKTPLSQNLDLESSLTIGGSLPATLFTYDFIEQSNSESPSQKLNYANFNYEGTWLASFRIGNPTYYKNEFGLFAAVGKVHKTAAAAEQSSIYRIGGDWTFKHKEQFRMTHQLVMGYTQAESGRGFNFDQKSALDYFLLSKWVLSFSNSLQYQRYSSADCFKGTSVASISYAMNPHTRLKLNAYSRYSLTSGQQQTGVFLQLVAGFGKRS